MKESYTILPIPAGDVSGIASALYELGGMVVIHDPSGCNSTYNTHDELRWYDKESNIFISGLNMRDAVLGNDKKFISDIVEAAETLSKERNFGETAGVLPNERNSGAAISKTGAGSQVKRSVSGRPNFIAICNSPVPYLNGTDFTGICKIVEKETGIPTFYVKSNGMHDYITGVQEAYVALAQKMLGDMLKAIGPVGGNSNLPHSSIATDQTKMTSNNFDENTSLSESEKKDYPSDSKNRKNNIRINILGATPLDYSHKDSISSLKKLLADDGFEVNSVWSFDTNFEEIIRTPKSDVNLVISSAGIPLAEFLKEKLLMPYIIGAPVTAGLNTVLCEDIRKAVPSESNENDIKASAEGDLKAEASYTQLPFSEIKSVSKEKISIIIGESVLSASIAAGIRAGQLDGQASKVAGIRAGQLYEDASGAAGTNAHDAIVFCPYPYKSPAMRDEDIYFDGEEELVLALDRVIRENLDSEIEVIADPLYRPVIPSNVEFTELPSLSISGRMYRSKFVDYFA